MKNNKIIRSLVWGICLMLAFALWTAMVIFVDVQPAGQNGTNIGMAGFNVWFHELTGVNMLLYTVTDWLGLVPVFICLCYGALGVCQWIQRKNPFRVDPDIILLGVYFVLVIAEYLIFEMIPINYRPVLIEGVLEASYPSSTTLLVLSVMPAFQFQTARRADNKVLRTVTNIFVISFSLFMVIGRLISGVHWFTDIFGSVLISFGIFFIYRFFVFLTDKNISTGSDKLGIQ